MPSIASATSAESPNADGGSAANPSEADLHIVALINLYSADHVRDFKHCEVEHVSDLRPALLLALLTGMIRGHDHC
jgi:hypothetical protein